MRYLLLLLLTFTSGDFVLAQPNPVVYHCIYSDTVMVDPQFMQKMIGQMSGDLARQHDIPESAVDKIDSAFRKQMSFRRSAQVAERIVVAEKDSTVITFGEVVHLGYNASLPYSRLVMTNGRTVSSVLNTEGERMQIGKRPDRNFRTTGAMMDILSYPCKEFISNDGTVTIWVTTSLPSCINPGIDKVDVPGAILGFSIRKETETVSSIMKSLKVN